MSLFSCAVDAGVCPVSVVWSSLRFGVLSWSTTQDSLVSVTCPLAIFEVSFVFCLS